MANLAEHSGITTNRGRDEARFNTPPIERDPKQMVGHQPACAPGVDNCGTSHAAAPCKEHVSLPQPVSIEIFRLLGRYVVEPFEIEYAVFYISDVKDRHAFGLEF